MRFSAVIRRAVQTGPPGTASMMGDRARASPEFEDRVARFADIGGEPGVRVAMLTLISYRNLEWFFACAWAGAVFVQINIRLAPPAGLTAYESLTEGRTRGEPLDRGEDELAARPGGKGVMLSAHNLLANAPMFGPSSDFPPGASTCTPRRCSTSPTVA